ncbi:hypothetical protein SD78_3474 [Bacillus badius]|nr:hypothetical protein SD78_3474 [Bacillus badius]
MIFSVDWNEGQPVLEKKEGPSQKVMFQDLLGWLFFVAFYR